MRTLLVNCSTPYPNLGLLKAEVYHQSLGNEVTWADRVDLFALEHDQVYLSALFTWDLPGLVEQARRAAGLGLEVQIGGPAVTLMAEWVETQTGIAVHRGLMPTWEAAWAAGGQVRPMTFTSRGCVRHCPFCAVPRLEDFGTVPDFAPAAVALDNNLLACGEAHVAQVADRLRGLHVDFNQGLDARLFDGGMFDLLRDVVWTWRFAFDSLSEEAPVARAVEMLRKADVPKRRIRIYVLYGFDDTVEDAVYRADQVVRWGASPYAMPYTPLDWMSRERYVPAQWTRRQHIDFRRFYRRADLWGNGMAFADYRYDWRGK